MVPSYANPRPSPPVDQNADPAVPYVEDLIAMLEGEGFDILSAKGIVYDPAFIKKGYLDRIEHLNKAIATLHTESKQQIDDSVTIAATSIPQHATGSEMVTSIPLFTKMIEDLGVKPKTIKEIVSLYECATRMENARNESVARAEAIRVRAYTGFSREQIEAIACMQSTE
jgi:hypothetical protein